ncbi:MAG TPA: hypothetical protein VEF76_01520 [Patescibacteria group bacterium]|nr:hypothetical protein [Patescibacteria group bacterium]
MAAGEAVKKNGMSWRVKFAFLTLLLAGLVFLPTTVLFLGCMIPTFVAALIDNSQQRTAWLTVGCMNFAGTVPAWMTLWEGGQRLNGALEILMQSSTLILAYGAAGIGWIIYYNVTPFVAGIMVMRTEKRLKDIEKRQAALVQKWGREVSGP